MITKIDAIWQSQNWQEQLATAIRSGDELLEVLKIDPADLPKAYSECPEFPLRVPYSYISRMRTGDPLDPLLLQVLPLAAENIVVPGYQHDPLEEASAQVAPGLIHKYPGRVLFITTPACAIHCRYCFRRHYPYQENSPQKAGWEQALDYIRADDSITEVILSGGDPLACHDNYLGRLTQALSSIPHLQRLRVHTRLPVVIPQRITQSDLAWLDTERFACTLVVHCNHPNELDSTTAAAFQHLRQHGVTLLNQFVLLRHINDDIDTLTQLQERSFDQGVLPYYMFLLDKVTGASHFDVDEQRACDLWRQLQARLPGYLVPRLAREMPQRLSKTLLIPETE